jgi:hypothetical protein
MNPVIVRIQPLLSAQRSLVTLDQLRNENVSDDQTYRLVRDHVFSRPRPRVFALGGVPESWERGLHAVVLSLDGAAASHASGGRLWSYHCCPEGPYEVTIGRHDAPTRAGVRIHRSSTLDEADVTLRFGIPCTTFERTLCDLTTRLTESQLGRILDDGLRRGVASLRRLKDCAERLESGPGRHMSAIRALLEVRDADYNPGGSDSELRVLAVLKRAGLPLPVQQHKVTVGSMKYILDYAYPPPKVFAEYYGKPYHGASAVAYDNDRITVLASAGWLRLVFTRASSDREIIERTMAALEERGVGSENRA